MVSKDTPVSEKDKYWRSKNGRMLKDSDILQLLKMYNERINTNINLHYKYGSFFVGFLSGIILAYLAAINQFLHSEIYFILLLVPPFIILLSEQGKLMSLRFYLGFLEGVVHLAKTENLLGLDGQVKSEQDDIEKIDADTLIWKDDPTFNIGRYIRDRKKFSNSSEFLKDRSSKAVSKYMGRVMNVFIILSFVLVILNEIVLFYYSEYFVEYKYIWVPAVTIILLVISHLPILYYNKERTEMIKELDPRFSQTSDTRQS